MKNNMKVVLLLLVMLELISTYFMYKSSNNKNIVLDVVELKDTINSDKFALYVDGEEYSGTTWPAGAKFDSAKSNCVNEKGDIISNALSFSNNKISLTTDDSTYCYLHFTLCFVPEIGLKSTTNITECSVGGLHRYQGTNVDNYICFGTEDKATCLGDTSSYLYRIIGINDAKEIKIIKAESQSTDDPHKDMNALYNYVGSEIQKKLNNFETGTDKLSKVINEGFWGNVVKDTDWLYGYTGSLSTANLYNGDYMYAIETGQKEVTYNSSSTTTAKNTWKYSVNSKIGLLYIHDYLYAYTNGNPGSAANAKKSWLTPTGYEWILPYQGGQTTSNGVLVYQLNSNGELTAVQANYSADCTARRGACQNQQHGSLDGCPECNTMAVRPVFYLKNNIEIVSGNGTASDPYMIKIPLQCMFTPTTLCTSLSRPDITNPGAGVTCLAECASMSFKYPTNATTHNVYLGSTSTNPLDSIDCVNNSMYYGKVTDDTGRTAQCSVLVQAATATTKYEFGVGYGGIIDGCTGTDCYVYGREIMAVYDTEEECLNAMKEAGGGSSDSTHSYGYFCSAVGGYKCNNSGFKLLKDKCYRVS